MVRCINLTGSESRHHYRLSFDNGEEGTAKACFPLDVRLPSVHLSRLTRVRKRASQEYLDPGYMTADILKNGCRGKDKGTTGLI